jgi:hypothetical protein
VHVAALTRAHPVGFFCSGFFNIIQALAVDIFPNQGGSITACVRTVSSSPAPHR